MHTSRLIHASHDSRATMEDYPPNPGSGPGGLAAHALYLDIDGTIVDIAPRPDAVEVPPQLLSLLRHLGPRLHGALAFVSGRPISEIDRLFHPLRLPAVGVHGGQIRREAQMQIVDEDLAQQLQQIEPQLRAGLAGIPGVAMENKHSVIALHYRDVPGRSRETLALAERVLGLLGPQFGVMIGKSVVEIRPHQFNKATGMQLLMQQPPFQGRLPIFAGDDTTDEDAFEFVNRAGGVSVRVGPAGAPTAATWRLDDPAALRAWLAGLAAA